ncbi:putative exonuclease VIII, ds DNA exonuclease encoded by prophage, partial [Escherichia coli EC1736]
NAHLEKTSRR